MSQDHLSIVITVAIIAGIFAWPTLLEIVYPRCARLLVGLRSPVTVDYPRQQRRRTDIQRRYRSS